MNGEKPPAGYLDTSDDQTWRPCLKCGKPEIIQVRKALFTCQNCNHQYISTEEDMRPTDYVKI